MLIPDRQWYANSDSSNYRFGFNGQEKDNEVAGVGNSMTAEFWQFDSRLGRRFNVDPKSNPQTSVYACFGNNPIYWSDPLGDTIKILHETGFLGFGKILTLTYRDKKLYNEDGTEYTGKVKGFLKNVTEGIDNMSKAAEGLKVVSQLSGSKNVFTIEKGTNEFSPTNMNMAGQNLTEIIEVQGGSRGSSGSGGHIYWNPANDYSGFDVNGNNQRPAYIGLAHEMFHASDADLGLLHGEQDLSSADNKKHYKFEKDGLEKNEWRAVYRENVLRGQLSLPLRAYYGAKYNNEGKMVPDGPRMLDGSNNPINYP